jgi:hypothetical protein
MKNNLMLLLLFLTGIGIFIGGCNDSSTDDDPVESIQISGTVATGAPLDTAVVTAVNIQGHSAGPVNVNTDGTYSLFVDEGAPYLLKAYSEQDDITLFSYSAGHATANITPLTSLALFVAAGLDSDLDDLYHTWKKNPVLESDVMTATRMVNANLSDLYTANHVHAGTYNFFETSFTTDGHGIDGVLDDLEIAVDPEASTIDTLLSIVISGENNIIFDLYTDISDFSLIDRITPAAAFEKISGGDALLVCAYDDESCKEILMENTLLKSELEQQMSSLPKSQEIIFY